MMFVVVVVIVVVVFVVIIVVTDVCSCRLRFLRLVNLLEKFRCI